MKKIKYFQFLFTLKAIGGLVGVVMAVWALTLVSMAENKTSSETSFELFKQVQLFADAITIIDADYVKEIEVKSLIQGAIKGMMKVLDGYSQFLDEDSFQDIKEETKGEFGGIGVEIGMRDGMLTIISPIEGTPASGSGLMAGDKIVKIDGEITRDITLDEAVRKLRGIPGSEVSLTVMRDDGEMMDISLERTIIKLQSIKVSKMISGEVAYMKLVEFQERTARDVDSALRKLKEDGALGLILDLRNNPGGLLDSAIDVSEKFLAKGTLIVYIEGRDPENRTEIFSKKQPEHGDIDMVVLVNKGSASAAEILAGALQDNKRALLLGETTFGKGSVQTVIPLRDNTALRLTTAAYYTPNGRNLMDKGIEPDILIKPVVRDVSYGDEETKGDRSKIFEKIQNGEDGRISQEGPENDKVISELEDQQILAALNILKGVRIFQANKERTQQGDI